MQPLKQLCQVREGVFDASTKSTVLDLTDLIENRINPNHFFETNYVTEGMRTLLREAFDRFSRRTQQGIFLLAQSMGGGKTHNMLALGLLAQNPQFRDTILESHHDPNLGRVRVAAFTGRESDAPLGVWGAIADQIGKKDQFSEYYSPLAPPGQSAWVNLLKGEPLLILLDELPPYFEAARARQIGNADLATVTNTALSNLFSAVNRPELENVCVVISDLTATYGEGSEQIGRALENLENEAGRTAMQLEPVQQNTPEVYHILRKQLFKSLPDEEAIREVAQAYAQAVKEARQMDVTDASPEQYAQRIQETYPFHFSIRDLYARFRENPGFQQTRGLIRLMRAVIAHMYESGRASERALIHPYDVDLNDRETLTQVAKVNPKLENAISHDIASGGDAVAEELDTKRGGEDARDMATLLLMASLSNVPKGVKGLTPSDIISYLCTPTRDVARLREDVLRPLQTRAWYLHSDTEGRILFKNVKNINAQLKDTARHYGRETRLIELKDFLRERFEPSIGDVYQRAQALPAVDEIEVTSDKVTLILAEPNRGKGLDDDLRAFYDDLDYQNRVLFLTGQRDSLRHLLEKSARLKGIRHIIDELKSERVSQNDPQFTAAQELQGEVRLQLLSAARETFQTLLFPHFNGLREANFLMQFNDNHYDGEEQIRSTLEDKGKFTADIESESFRKKCEKRLFTQQTMLWSEVKRRAASNPKWSWHRPDALDRLKQRMLREDQWREEDQYVKKGPFAPPETDLRVKELHRDSETGEVTLRIIPVHGDTVYYEIGADATTASEQVKNLNAFKTDALRLSFLCVDTTGKHETGDPVTFENEVTIQHRVFPTGNGTKKVELKAVPSVPIRYTTDGSNPRNTGGRYDGPVEVERGTEVVQAVPDVSDNIAAEPETVRLDWDENTGVQVDKSAPAVLKREQSCTATKETYDFLKQMDSFDVVARGPRVGVDAEQWADLTFDRTVEMDADTLRKAIDYVRDLMGSEGEVTLEASTLRFPTGQHLLDWAESAKVDLTSDDISQE